MSPTFITGNENKARLLREYLGVAIEHRKLDLEEIQSLDLREITEHKARQAYAITGTAVLVEDVSLVIKSMGGLPGPLIKWFLQEIGAAGLCKLADINDSREAVASVTYVYFDGNKLEYFDGSVAGKIAKHPRGEDFGWNPTFIPFGSDKTYAEMNSAEIEKFGLRNTTVYPLLREFLHKFIA